MIKSISSLEAERLLKIHGLNKLPDPKSSSLLTLLFAQFKNLFSTMLVVAVILSFAVGDFIDGYLILVILLLNAGLGFWQEYKASREISLLRNYEPPKSRVIRDGEEAEVLSETLVPGDIVILEAGNKIPADGILIEGYGVAVNESSLTGESVPAGKSAKDNNELFLGTWITNGKGRMEVTATGKNTRFGKIALNLGNILEEKTPLELALNRLAIRVTLLIISITLLLAILTIIQGTKIFDVFLSSIALIIAAVPEGLPAIITVLLAIGVRRMYQKKSLVRKMSSIESLGTTDVICIDKTGTITTNQMSVRKVELFDDTKLYEFIRTAIVCNTASLVAKEGDGFDILGDTMEGAMLLWSHSKEANIDDLRFDNKIVREIPFDSKRKMMSVLVEKDGKTELLAKGAPEIILELCDLSDKEKQELTGDYEDMAKQGLRILALACRDFSGKKLPDELEQDLEFLGFVGIADEPREEAKASIEKARRAGIEIVMITGDNELTAKVIGEEVGLMQKGDEIITGEQLDKLSNQELKERLDKIRIYARTTPEHKLRIVKNFQELGKMVAVTGDGVNDSLALKKAEVGISMGITGTDVAKEASDIIILDDNLSTIVEAIEQGRLIYGNIVKVVRFLLTGNLSEVLLILIITLMGYPVPLLPAQILWINFVTDGLPAISLAADKSTGKEMKDMLKGKDRSLFNIQTLKFVSFFGLFISLVSVASFVIGFNSGGIDLARSYAFTTMIVSQMAFVVLVIRRGSPILSNKYLIASVILVLLFQLIILIFQPLGEAFQLSSL